MSTCRWGTSPATRQQARQRHTHAPRHGPRLAACLPACPPRPTPTLRLPQLIAKVLPSREAINEVERIAKSFWREHPEKFIAIHCAYGGPGLPLCTRLPVWPSCMALQRRAYQLQRRGPWSHA